LGRAKSTKDFEPIYDVIKNQIWDVTIRVSRYLDKDLLKIGS